MSETRAFEGRADEGEEEADIYLRCNYKNWYYWIILNKSLLSSPTPGRKICECGAEVYIGKRCLARTDKFLMNSSAVCLGSKIYEFGGLDDVDDDAPLVHSDEVSYIDTACPEQGWKMCKNKMLSAQQNPYALTLKNGKVLLMDCFGGYKDDAFIQMYDSFNDTWKALGSYNSTLRPLGGSNAKDDPYPSIMVGHAVLDDDRYILMHDISSPKLFQYDVVQNLWGVRWGPDFGRHKDCSTLVDGILYVLDTSVFEEHEDDLDDHEPDHTLFFSGYDINSKHPKPLPVKLVYPQGGYSEVEVLPLSGGEKHLLSLGNNKVAMVWHDRCYDTPPGKPMVSVWCSTFKMTKSNDGGGLQLAAEVLSNCCYHVDGYPINACLAIPPSKKCA